MTSRPLATTSAAVPTEDIGSGARLMPGLHKPRDLARMKPGQTGRVIELAVEDDLAAWLRAVGIGEGEVVRVLRRAAFGGPVHVRTRAGGEFALNRGLAERILVRLDVEGRESAA